MSGDDELKKAFFTESEEIIGRMEADLAILEKQPKNLDTINAVFRSLHTIKGNSSFLNFDNITKLSHVAEAMLDKARKGERLVTPGLIRISQAVLSQLKDMILAQNIGANQSKLIAQIEKFNAGDEAAANSVERRAESTGQIIQSTFVRVDEKKMARLVSDVSELELVRYNLERFPEKIEGFGKAGSDLRFELEILVGKILRISKSLSGVVFGVRLVPVNQVFQRFPKVVTDLAKKLNKDIRLSILKGDAELDKIIVDAIADPMTHLIRNACDHGIEKPEARIKANKRPNGTIQLNSFVRGNYVCIEIADDGGGIDGDRVAKKAIEKGIVTAEKVAKMSNQDKIGLIFAPGFSMAEQVTDISGRGVGMDVVKANINKLKGTVVIESRVGRGTVIQLRFPMSLAVMYLVFVEVAGISCAVPVDQVEESFDFFATEFKNTVPEGEDPNGYLALYSVRALMWGDGEFPARERFHVLRAAGRGAKNMGFVVEEYHSIEDAVVQSVDSYIAALPGVQGGTVTKDGGVAIVLNPTRLVELAKKAQPVAYVKIPEKTKNVQQNLSEFLELASANEEAA
jgi:two-component system chemotaxis sensor kinase CheA